MEQDFDFYQIYTPYEGKAQACVTQEVKNQQLSFLQVKHL